MSKFHAKQFLEDLANPNKVRKDLTISNENYQPNHDFLVNLPLMLQPFFGNLARQAIQDQYHTIWLGQVLRNIKGDRPVPIHMAPYGDEEEQLCEAIRQFIKS